MNNLGFRMHENISIKKDPNKKRIFLLGDSFTEGANLGDEDTVAVNLQKLLPNNYEVINMGVSSFGTVQEFMYR